jgi:hypothetical protein
MKIIFLLLAAVSLLIPFQAGQTPGNKKEAPTAKSPPPITTVNNNYEASKNPDKAEDNPHWYKRPEWWLVIGAFLTMGFVAWQALETRRVVEAATSQTKAIVESQRPKIAAKPHGNPIKDLSDRDAPRMQIELANKGLLAAYDLVYKSWIELLPLPFEDFTAAADHHKSPESIVMYPDHTPLIVNIPIRKGITEQELSDVKRLRLYVCVRVRVEYRDVFSPKRYAEFGFCVMYDGLGFLPKYNNAS